MTTYTEQIIWSILKTSFTKQTFCYLLLSLITIIFRTHIDSFIAYLFATEYYYLNSLIRIIISSTLLLNTKYFYDIIVRYKPEVYKLTKFLINNYTPKNFRRWKRKLTFSICIYFYIITYIIDISCTSIRFTIIEYIICYGIVELFDKIKSGEIKIFKEKEFSCSSNDDAIIDDLIKKNNFNDGFDEYFFDIKKS